jgi:hypothetical protein
MPTPTEAVGQKTFAEIVPLLLAGKKLRRESWPNEDAIFLHASMLHIRNATGLHQLQVSEGDLLGADWVEVTED